MSTQLILKLHGFICNMRYKLNVDFVYGPVPMSTAYKMGGIHVTSLLMVSRDTYK